jgi:GT2 family glycosyltransferase
MSKVYPLRYLRSTPFNKAKALNAGIAAAKSEWLVFTDDDTLPDPDWLVCGAQYAKRSGLRVFGGRIVAGEDPPELPTWLRSGRSGRVPDIGVHVRYEPLTASGLVQSHQMAPLGANMFCCRDVFAEYGGYDEELWDLCKARWSLGCEDSEFGHRLKLRGEPIGYCREAVVVHPVNAERASIRLHLRRAYSEGWRQPLIFTEECRPWFEPFRVRSLVMFAVGAVRDVWRRDWAGAMERLVEMVRTCGGIAGRWSGAYRVRMQANCCHDKSA